MSEEAWAEARAAELQDDESLWQQEPASRRPTWTEVVGAVKITGEQIKVTFFGVSQRDGWLNGNRVTRRPLLSADYLCADYFSLKLINGSDGLNLKSFIHHMLQLSVSAYQRRICWAPRPRSPSSSPACSALRRRQR